MNAYLIYLIGEGVVSAWNTEDEARREAQRVYNKTHGVGGVQVIRYELNRQSDFNNGETVYTPLYKA